MDSNLNITIRVAGRQAQAEIRAVAKEIDQVQRMVGKKPTTAGATSAWSPAIARQQARQAQAAQKATQAAQAKHQQQVWRSQVAAGKQQQAAAKAHAAAMGRVQSQQWKAQQVLHKQAIAKTKATQAAANRALLTQQKTQAAKMSKIGGLTPLGFAQNLDTSKLVNAGKNINWVGRQLTYNFTLPLALAGAGLFKFSMDIERASTQLSKVYGDVRDDPRMLKAELDALSESFELLSSRFGVNQVEVIEIAAAWAAAGSAGSALAENTRATIEQMIIGDMDAQQATEGLIAIQAQWGFSTKKNAEGVSELTQELANLNAVENTTGVSTEDLIDIIQRAGGTARTSGAELRELAALAAALVPATGGAAQAGTALRSIISGLMAPTAAATEALGLMGIEVADPAWLGVDVVEKLKILAAHFEDLSDAQKGIVSSTIATKWQVSRFDVLMKEINSSTGFYARALEVTKNGTDALEISARELDEVLKSHPKQFDIMTNAAKNALADAFLPLIPAIMSVVALISDLAIAFSELSPETQKMIILGLLLVAVLGPLMSLLGSTMQLFGVFGSMMKPVGKAVGWLIKSALFPLIKTLGMLTFSLIQATVAGLITFLGGITAVGWVIIAVIAAIVAGVLIVLNTDFEDKVWEILQSVGTAFSKLPGVIGRALMTVLRVVGHYVTEIGKALSFLNPFARHSPSLVENVRNGVTTILEEYGRLNQIPNLIRSAASALEAFSMATSSEGKSFREIELQKKANVSAEAAPQAAPAANALVQSILALEAQLPALQAEINSQEMVVEQWTQKLKAADLEIEAMEEHLAGLEKAYNKMGDAIAAAESKIGELANTPIEGLGAMEDAIFANQHAQKLLNLELLEFEKRGLTLDSIKNKYAEMAGEIETLRGTQEELRTAGAGSDILGWYDQQIAAIEAQKTEMAGVEQTITDIEKRLDDLDLEGRFLDLTKAINFDPLERQIERLANSITEMPFDEIVRQITEQQAIVNELAPQYEEMAEQIERERDAIEAAKTARGAIADQLEAEQARLDSLEEAYNDITGLIQDMEQALNDFASAAEQAKEDLEDTASRLAELFEAAEGLDFEDFGGTAALGREGFLADIEAFNEEMERLLAEAMEEMGNLDLITPLKEAWEKAKAWLKTVPDKIKEVIKEWWPVIAAAVAVGLVGVFLGIPAMLIVVGGLMAGALLYAFWDEIMEFLKDRNNWLVLAAAFVVGLIGFFVGLVPMLIVAAGLLVGALIAAFWDQKDEIYAFWTTVGWDCIKGLASGIWQALQTWWDDILEFLNFLWQKIKGFFGVESPSTLFFDLGVDLIQGLLNGLGSMMAAIGEWFLALGLAIVGWVNAHIVQPIWETIKPGLELVAGLFDWLWEKIKWAWEKIGEAITWVWENVIQPVWDAIKEFIEKKLVPAFEWLWAKGKELWDLLGSAISFVWTTIIQPIFDGIKSAIENVVVPAFQWLWDEGNRIFTGLGNSLKWVWDNVISPIWDGFRWAFEHVVKPAFDFLRDSIIKPIMESIYTAIASVWNAINGVIEGGVNFFITAFNLIGSAVNGIARFLGIDAKVPTINPIVLDDISTSFSWPNSGPSGGGGGRTFMASGGVVDRAGGLYNAPTAIVGEGSRIYPEFVIPTDPQYRSRAFGLMQMLGTRLMAAGGIVGQYETLYESAQHWNPPTGGGVGSGGGGGSSGGFGGSGSWLDKVMNALVSAGKAVVRGAVMALWTPAKALADVAINRIPNHVFQQGGRGIMNVMDNWVRGRSNDWDANADKFATTGGTGRTGSGAVGYVQGIPITHSSGSWHAFVTLLQRMGIPYQNLGTYVNRQTKYGTPSMHAQNRAMDFGGTQMQLQRIDHALYDAFKSHLHELIWSGPNARNVYRGVDHMFRQQIMDDHRTHVHASMQRGGRFDVPRVPGGVNMRIAEGRSGEQVQVLPVDDNAMGGTTIIINGNLEFPNVTNGGDAKGFIENLKALA